MQEYQRSNPEKYLEAVSQDIDSWVANLVQQDPKQQKWLVDRLLNEASLRYGEVLDLIDRLGDTFIQLPVLMDQYGGVASFCEQHSLVVAVKDSKAKRRAEQSSTIKNVKKFQPGLVENYIEQFVPRMLDTHQAISGVAFVLRRINLQEASYLLNMAAIRRIETPNRTKDRWINGADWAEVKSLIKEICSFACKNTWGQSEIALSTCKVLRTEAEKAGLKKADVGYSAQKAVPCTHLKYGEMPNPAAAYWTKVVILFRNSTNPNTGVLYSDESVKASRLKGLGVMRHSVYRILAPYTRAIENEPMEENETAENARYYRQQPWQSKEEESDKLVSSDITDLMEEKIMHSRFASVSPNTLSVDVFPPSENGNNAYDEGCNTRTNSNLQPIPGDDCKCDSQHAQVLALANQIVVAKDIPTKEKQDSPADSWYYEVDMRRAGTKTPSTQQGLCFRHTQAVARNVDVANGTEDHIALNHTLSALFPRKNQCSITRSASLSGFRRDAILNYRYQPNTTSGIFKELDWDSIGRKTGLTYIVQQYEKTGSVVLNCFEWMFDDPELERIIDTLFRMYKYHQRRVHGRENLGWVRFMCHSLIQQAIRVDLGYWMIYAMLRGEHTLLSYPYYTMYAQIGADTAFRHIDQAVINGGADAKLMHGSISLDNEDENNCTEILMGFHRHVPEYRQWRETTGRARTINVIQGWKDENDWPQVIQDKLPDIKWIRQPCKRGQVRISHPLLPYGSTGPMTVNRRIIPCWYVVVRNGTMENPNLGTYEEICKAHRELLAAPRSPSGYPNKYGGTDQPFPADVRIDLQSYIQRALVGQVHWGDPMVRREMHIVFGNGDEESINKFIARQQVHVANEIKRLFPIVEMLERDAFRAVLEEGIPDRSFFSNQGIHPPHGDCGWSTCDKEGVQEEALRMMQQDSDTKPDERQRAVKSRTLVRDVSSSHVLTQSLMSPASSYSSQQKVEPSCAQSQRCSHDGFHSTKCPSTIAEVYQEKIALRRSERIRHLK
ncbi:hypothetical protein J3E71DRAFT_171917 [Bipolaris maydis]|nr:hypothetical protein J3E71DRAFT_171537 [Bipolaris maydis]KAJ6284244.1 hypothetical protein J3E71DRAFT_171917 [Bipolaris maydis]